MMIGKVIWGMVGFFAILTVIFLAIGLIAMARREGKRPRSLKSETPPSKKSWHSWFSESDFFLSILGFLAIWIEIYLLLPDWWGKRWIENWKVLIATLVMLSIAKLISKPPSPANKLRYRLARVVLILGVIDLTYFIALQSDYGRQKAEEWRTEFVNWWYSDPAKDKRELDEAIRIARMQLNERYWRNNITPANKKVADAMWNFFSKNLTPNQAELQMQICYEEAMGFRQNGPDGTVLKSPRNTDGTVDFGACQVNSVHIKKALELIESTGENYDFREDLESNLRMTLYIIQTQGPTAWAKYESALAVMQGAPDATAPALAKTRVEPHVVLTSVPVVAKKEVCDIDNPIVITAVNEYSKLEKTVPEGGGRTFITIPEDGVVIYQDQTGAENSITGPTHVRFFLDWSDVKSPEGRIRFRSKNQNGSDTPAPVEVRMYNCQLK